MPQTDRSDLSIYLSALLENPLPSSAPERIRSCIRSRENPLSSVIGSDRSAYPSHDR